MSSDADVLLKLVQGEEGEDWADGKRGWSPRVDVCSWEGIGCAENNTVVNSIQLPKADLLASLPSELGLLTSLEIINLKKNQLYGTIPSQLASLPRLVQFNVEENQLKGKLPAFSSSRLEILDISHNNLEGRIPPEFGELNYNLSAVDLQQNFLSGFLPFGLQSSTNLTTISLSFNQLSGTLPNYLGSLSTLKFLYLNHNHLVGTIPETLVLSESGSALKEIWLHQNILSGSIPQTLAEASTLRDVYLDGNKLTGTVPRSLCRENINADFFKDLPEGVDRNFCDSVTCPAATVSEEGVFPCTDCASTIHSPYLGRTGECEDLTEQKIIEKLVGVGLPSSSVCDIEGITCNENGNVIHIHLSSSGLNGTLPDEVGFLKFLRELDVSDNELTGFLPSSLRFAPLEVLKIKGNKFTGIVTPLLCLRSGINGNGENGAFSCNNIACPIGTYGNGTGFGECLDCPLGAPFLGSFECNAPTTQHQPVKPRSRHSSSSFGIVIAIVVSGIMVSFVVVFLVWKAKRKSTNSTGHVEGIKVNDSENGVSSSLPHVEEAKSFLGRLGFRGSSKRDKEDSQWLQKHLKTSFSYVSSLAEIESVWGTAGQKPKKGIGGEIDDYGWREREAILFHRDIENAVQTQMENGSKTDVWEYPDPLERAGSYSESGENSSSETSLASEDDDLHEWIKKQQNDPATRDVWLDVPRIE